MVRVEEDSEWVLPANMKQAARDATGVYATHQAYASGEDLTQIEPHAIVDFEYARLYAQGLSCALRRRGVSLSGRILDVGCALGTITQALSDAARDGTDCWGIDLSPILIDWAVRRWPDCRFLVCSADELDSLSYDTFDVVHAREFYPFSRSASAELHWHILDAFVANLRPGGAVAVVQIVDRKGMADTFADLKRDARDHGYSRIERCVLVPQRLFRMVGGMAYWPGVYGLIAAAGRILEQFRSGKVSYLFLFRKDG